MPSPRFEKLAPATKAAILQAARAEFAEHGFEGSSYNRIIANSKLSKSSLYYYFHSKEDLYITVVQDAVAQFAEAVGEAREVTTVEEFWAECARLLRRFFEFGMQNPVLFGILRGVPDLEPGRLTGDLMTEITVKDSLWYERIIERGQALGAIRSDGSVGLVVELFFAVFVVWTKWRLKEWLRGEPIDTEQTVARIIDLFRRMATPSPADVAKAVKGDASR